MELVIKHQHQIITEWMLLLAVILLAITTVIQQVINYQSRASNKLVILLPIVTKSVINPIKLALQSS